MHFGIALDLGSTENAAKRINDIIPIAVEAEKYGFDSVWFGESYPSSDNDPRGFHLPNALMAAVVVGRETSLNIGTGATLLRAWHPIRLAHDAALADQLLNGRLTLGIGLGPSSLTRKFPELPQPESGAIDESIKLVRKMWGGEPSHHGEYFTVTSGVAPRPFNNRQIPILVGGGVERSARRAARIGDGYFGSTGYSLEHFSRLVAVYRDELIQRRNSGSCGARLSQPSQKAMINRITVVDHDSDTVQQIANSYARKLLDTYADIGTHSQPVGSQVPRDGSVALIGTPPQIVEQILYYRDQGVTNINFRLSFANVPLNYSLRAVRLLGGEVLPTFDRDQLRQGNVTTKRSD